MLERIKGVLVLLPLLIAFFCGSIVFSLIAILIGCIAFIELRNALNKKEIYLSIAAAGLATALMILRALGFVGFLSFSVIAIAVSFLLATLLVFQRQSFSDASANVLSLLYAFVPFCFISNLYSQNMYLAMLVFVISFATDIFAYLSGKFFGKHKLMPKVSPNKTIEGSVGGIIGATLVSTLFLFIVKIPILPTIPICMIGSVAAQLGDLFASSIKRYCGIKDFGKLIPGHGGVLDRFDSVMFVALLMCVFV